MAQNILVIHYSQSGQLTEILQNFCSPFTDSTIEWVKAEPLTPFPFPWNSAAFFNAMPETVLEKPIPIKPLHFEREEYDLIIFGYQPWFLNPSQPTTGFLKSEWAAKLLKDKPMVTVVGCRNMWLHGQEKVKEDLNSLGAKLVGNIVFLDTNPNLISLLTVIRWAFKGQKEASGMLPAAGVQDVDIAGAKRFGPVISEHIAKHNLDTLQSALLDKGSISLNPGLVLLEQRGIKNFRYWAKFIREKGGPGDPNRKGRVKLFQRLLLTAIFILSPLSSLTAAIKLQLKKKSLLKDVEYFKGVRYEKGRI